MLSGGELGCKKHINFILGNLHSNVCYLIEYWKKLLGLMHMFACIKNIFFFNIETLQTLSWLVVIRCWCYQPQI